MSFARILKRLLKIGNAADVDQEIEFDQGKGANNTRLRAAAGSGLLEVNVAGGGFGAIGSGSGGLRNFTENGDFETNLDGWAESDEFGAPAEDITTQLEGKRSLKWTNNEAGGTRGKMTGNINAIDLGFDNQSFVATLLFRMVGTGGQYLYYITEDAVKIDASEITIDATVSGTIIPLISGGFRLKNGSTYKHVIEDVSGTNGDVITIDVVELGNQGGIAGGSFGPIEDITGDITYNPSGITASTFEVSRSQDQGENRFFNCYIRATSVAGSPAYVDIVDTIDVTKLAPLAGSTVFYMTDIVARRIKNTGGDWNDVDMLFKGYVDAANPTRIYFSEDVQNASSLVARNWDNLLVPSDGLHWTGSVPVTRLADNSFRLASKGSVLQNARARFYNSSNTALGAAAICPFDTPSTLIDNFGVNNNNGEMSVDAAGTYFVYAFIQRSTGTWTVGGGGRMDLYKNGARETTMGNMEGTDGCSGWALTKLTPSDVFSCRMTAAYTTNAGDIGGTFVFIARHPDDTGLFVPGVGTSLNVDEVRKLLLMENEKKTLEVYVTDDAGGGAGPFNAPYEVIGGVVHFDLSGVEWSTGNTALYLSTSQTAAEWPAELRPATNRGSSLVRMRDIGNHDAGYVEFGSDGVNQMFRDTVGAAFTAASGIKGIQDSMLSYKLKT